MIRTALIARGCGRTGHPPRSRTGHENRPAARKRGAVGAAASSALGVGLVGHSPRPSDLLLAWLSRLVGVGREPPKPPRMALGVVVRRLDTFLLARSLVSHSAFLQRAIRWTARSAPYAASQAPAINWPTATVSCRGPDERPRGTVAVHRADLIEGTRVWRQRVERARLPLDPTGEPSRAVDVGASRKHMRQGIAPGGPPSAHERIQGPGALDAAHRLRACQPARPAASN